MSPPLAQELELAKVLARQAGARILEHYAAGFEVQWKSAGSKDPVTQADKDANSIIVDGLAKAFPADAILAEESVDSPSRHAHRRLWCIDPLDGTAEFIEKNGQFSVMIGLAIDGEARLGVVFQPTEDTLYFGAAGRAYVERRGAAALGITTSRTSAAPAAVMMVSRSHRSNRVTAVAQAMGVERQRPLGSVGLKVVQIAEASADLYLSVSTSTREWDACAPEAILAAAGGLMTDSRGAPLRYNKPTTETPYGLLASNGPLHPAAMAAVKQLPST